MLDDELPGQHLPTGPTHSDEPNDNLATAAPADSGPDATEPATPPAPRRRAPRRRAAAPAGPAAAALPGTDVPGAVVPDEADGTGRPGVPAVEPAVTDEASGAGRARPARRTASRPAAPAVDALAGTAPSADAVPLVEPAAPAEVAPSAPAPARRRRVTPAMTFQPPVLTFQPPERVAPAERVQPPIDGDPDIEPAVVVGTDEEPVSGSLEDEGDDDAEATPARSRRRRGRRGRGRPREDDGDGGDSAAESVESEIVNPDPVAATESEAESTEAIASSTDVDDAEVETGEGDGTAAATRRRRRRRRRGAGEDGEATPAEASTSEPPARSRRPATARDREPAGTADGVRGVTGSTRLEAKRQRRRDGRDTSRRRTPIVTEAEFLARRESVDRTMLVRQNGERTQIAVLEDGVLVEHYVTKASNTSYAGNVYLGKVQNVLPSMEAAFVDIGKGRNAVLYAGEVNYDATGLEGKPHKIEQALKSGQNVLVQVTKDPMGHKGARLTSQISLAGRYLVYVPESSMTGISRKLPDVERSRLKAILKRVVPENAGVIVRTAAEGASEDELSRDVDRLEAQWQDIRRKADKIPASGAPVVLYTEPDLAVRVVRDVFNEDFAEMAVQGDSEWDTIKEYVGHVAPDLAPRLRAYEGTRDIFAEYRVDEQLAKALDRKVWLPSGGSLVIDRTEAMVVIDVNTGKFTGKGGNLEETVTKNNLEAAEEIVRQLRLRDLGGMIVVDFIDMVLESNRDLVLRRLTECLGRDRTKHQVAEVTSLGLVQMTRKRVGQGLLEAFSVPCEVCHGRGVRVSSEPIDHADGRSGDADRGGRSSADRPVPTPRPGPPPGYDRANGAPVGMPVEPPEPEPDELETTERAAVEPTVVEPTEVEPADVEPVATEPVTTEPVTTEPGTTEPVATEPAEQPTATPAGTAASGPVVEASEPERIQPAAAEPAGAVEDHAWPTTPVPRRRRGSARRPAGPPVVAAPVS